MKKILYFSVLMLAFTGYSQKSQITFDNLLEYSLNTNSSEEELNDMYKIKLYMSSLDKILLFEGGNFNYSNAYSFLKDGKYLTVNSISFDRTVNLPIDNIYNSRKDSKMTAFFSNEIELESMNKKGEFKGRTCNYYKFIVSENSENNEFLPLENTCLCIDEKSKVKNLKTLLPKANMDGLIVAYGHIDYPGEAFVLNEIKKTDIKVDFDFDEGYKISLENFAKYQEENDYESQYYATDTAAVVTDSYYNNYYSDPLCNGYEYFQDLDENTRNYALKFYNLGCELSLADSDYDSKPDLTREQAIQIAKKQSQLMTKQGQKNKVISKDQAKLLTKAFEKLYKEADAYVPVQYVEEVVDYAVESSDWDTESVVDYGYRNYASDYKSMQIDVVNLAAESDYNGDVSNYMPDYCSNLKQNVPNFKNQDLKKHVYNLVGQICDLYLYQNGGSVDYFGTIDSMRKSLLEIENLRSKLSNNDLKLLNDYLNSLD
ncbi:hypothetical protein [Flavobacterium sp. I3-2]|uniref:hypothetical protein n=1 Tax=Flavobacterium sp. I3-2 TaxID=2748319 RepID=UPI0015ADE023|nr:hypothetical protein [Flavobacterium sp. I3-2]